MIPNTIRKYSTEFTLEAAKPALEKDDSLPEAATAMGMFKQPLARTKHEIKPCNLTC